MNRTLSHFVLSLALAMLIVAGFAIVQANQAHPPVQKVGSSERVILIVHASDARIAHVLKSLLQ